MSATASIAYLVRVTCQKEKHLIGLAKTLGVEPSIESILKESSDDILKAFGTYVRQLPHNDPLYQTVYDFFKSTERN